MRKTFPGHYESVAAGDAEEATQTIWNQPLAGSTRSS